MAKYETEAWPVIQASQYRKTPKGIRRQVDGIVIHAMQAPEKVTTAENIAHWFANKKPDEPVSSVHICTDSDSIVQCVMDNDVAFGAGGYNDHAIHIELAGYAEQTLAEWMDAYGVQLLNRAADAAAQYCLKYAIEPVWLTDQQLRAGGRGLIGHDQVSRVFKRSDHTDPGTHFPRPYFIEAVRTFVEVRRPA